MKKIYTKPEIMFEDFSLSKSIAAGCEAKTNMPSENACGMDYGGLGLFIENMTGCEDIGVTDVGGDGQYNELCYHVPLGGDNLFTS